MSLLDWVLDVLEFLPPHLVIFVIAMLPFVELRGAIPVGLLFYDLPVVDVVVLAVLGNMLPVPIILAFLRPVEKILRHIGFMDRFLTWLYARTRRRSSKRIEDYEEAALMLFVAIPLPVTGAWTGALVAYLFDLPVRKSLFFIFVGVLIAAVVVTLLVSAGISVFTRLP